MRRRPTSSWQLLPGSLADIQTVRKKCRSLVLRRAAVTAGLSALPIPGIDIAADITMLARVIDDINLEFGLTPEQVARLQPKMRLIVYEMAVGVGGLMIGRIVTRDAVARLLRRGGFKAAARYSVKIVPIAGQIAAASISFAAFRALANQHIEACARIASAVLGKGGDAKAGDSLSH
jgi:hypothetical protein